MAHTNTKFTQLPGLPGLVLIDFAKVPICLVAPAPPALELLVDGVPQSVVGGPFKLFFTIDIVFVFFY